MRWLIASVLLLTSSAALAEGPLYGEVLIGAGGVRHSDLDFYPTLGSVSVGAYVLPGIGVELFGDVGLADSEDGGFDVSVEEAYGVAARFQSPPSRGLQGFIVLGAVSYSIEQRSAGSGSARISEEFTGVRASVGLMQRLERFPNLLVTAEYRHYNADEPLRLDAVLIGLRLNTP